MATMGSAIITRNGSEIIGQVNNGGCSHPTCRKAIRNGRPFHAITNDYRATLPTVHYATFAEAMNAVTDAMADYAGFVPTEK